MNIDELIQSMRLISLAEFRKRAKLLEAKDKEFYEKLCNLIDACKRRPEWKDK